MYRAVFSFLTVTVLIWSTGIVEARPHRPQQIPNGTLNSCSNCHVNPGGGGPRTPFGEMVLREFLNGSDVTWNPLMASLDADGDGITNGEELGDPFGEWSIGMPNPGDPTLVSLPGNADQNAARTLTLNLTGYDAHIGQFFGLKVIDRATGQEVGRATVASIPSADFSVSVDGIQDGRGYYLDFFADLSGNQLYEPPPTDHAWRAETADGVGDRNINYPHNTGFTDIQWDHVLTMNFSGMQPHSGQLLEVRVINEDSQLEVGRARIEILTDSDFTVRVPGLRAGGSYRADFYADLNNNGKYDGTPTDHAWSMSFTNPAGNATLDFSHNTNFTDINWGYLFRLNLLAMDPHLNQLLELRVVDESNEVEVGRTALEPLAETKSAVLVPGVEAMSSYRADFYADLNNNGGYDAPPTDHAWREMFSNMDRNVVMNFSHNTNFTDIEWPSLSTDNPLPAGVVPVTIDLAQNYPNPFNPETSIRYALPQASQVRLEVFNTLGQSVALLVDGARPAGIHTASFSGSGLASGIYYYQLQAGDNVATRRMLLLK